MFNFYAQESDKGFPGMKANVTVDVCDSFAATAQMDVRFRLNHKNFLTVRGGVFQDKDKLADLVRAPLSAYAFGAEFGQKTIIGPMKIGAQWCNKTGFSVALSVGFDF